MESGVSLELALNPAGDGCCVAGAGCPCGRRLRVGTKCICREAKHLDLSIVLQCGNGNVDVTAPAIASSFAFRAKVLMIYLQVELA